jgi:hypothetical protein
MTLHELVQALAVRDVKLSLRLVVDAPRGAITNELQDALAAHKPHLLARLGRHAQWEALSAERWGPALHDLQEEDSGPNAYSPAERLAIQQEHNS